MIVAKLSVEIASRFGNARNAMNTFVLATPGRVLHALKRRVCGWVAQDDSISRLVNGAKGRFVNTATTSSLARFVVRHSALSVLRSTSA